MTVKGSGRVNANTAPLDILLALGVAEADARTTLRTRGEEGGLDQLPTGTPGTLGATSSGIFRVDSVGMPAGVASALRITAIVQNEGDPSNPRLRVISWAEGL